MSYVKVILPELCELKNRIESNRDKWINHYSKYGVMIGNMDSMSYLINEIEKYYENTKS